MSGVRCGTRLDQLRALRRRIDLEIMVAAREEALARPIVRSRPERRGRNTVDEQLAELGVTSHDVKVWALQAGLVSEIKRGRIGQNLVDSYRSAVLVAALGPVPS